MKLFRPNNLSRRRPEFTQLEDQTISREVVSLLEHHYALANLSDLKISVFCGANISSQNLKLETPAAKWFLKSREKSSEKKMRAEAELTFALSELGQKVPRIIRSRHEELTRLYENKCWMLYEFQEGDYFAGKGNELQAAAEAFGRLSLAAKHLFQISATDVRPVPDGLENLLNLSDLKATEYPEVAQLCATHREVIIGRLSEVEKHQSSSYWLPMHLDYHPLNLLMDESGVACIVDLEHLKPCPVEVGLGFAAYKLIRQAMCDEAFRMRESSQPTAVSTWLRGWQKSFPEDQFRSRELGLGARSRILTLIHLILDAFLTRNDDRFNYDLEKQIVSLYEVDAIFG